MIRKKRSAKLFTALTRRCPACAGSGWLCELHTLSPMGHKGCGGVGTSCRCNPEELALWDEQIGDPTRLDVETRRAETARQFEEAKNTSPKPAVRCGACRKADREFTAMVEMGGHIFCNECIELAALIIAVRKSGSSPGGSVPI